MTAPFTLPPPPACAGSAADFWCPTAYITSETAYALGIDRYGRLWCAMSTGKCAVMQDDRVLAMLDAELFFEDGSVISCLT